LLSIHFVGLSTLEEIVRAVVIDCAGPQFMPDYACP